MKSKKLITLLSSVSALTLSSCSFSAITSSTTHSDTESYYKTITYSVGTTGGHFIGPTKVKFKSGRPFYTIQRPEAYKEGFTLSCWTTTQGDISTKVKPTQIITSDLTLYPYFVDSTSLGDVIYTVTTDYLYIWDRTTLCATDSSKIKGVRRSSETQEDVTIARDEFNFPLSFGTKIYEIPNNFLYGCSGFDSEVTIPAWIISIGNDFMHGCTSYNKQLIVPSSVRTIGNNFLYGCYAFNKDLILNSTLTSIGTHFMVENRAFTSKLTIDCPMTAFAEETATDSLYSTLSDSAIYTTGYQIDGTYAQDFWWKYVDTSTTNCYRRRQAVRVTTVSVTVNSKTEAVKDNYKFDVYFDDYTSWDPYFYIYLTISRESTQLTAGTIVATAHSITDASGQEFSAAQAGELGRFSFDEESSWIKVYLKDASGNALTPRGNITITLDLDLVASTHEISGDHNLDLSKSTFKFSIPATNENINWSIEPASMGTITDEGVLSPSAEAIANGGSAVIKAQAASGGWTATDFPVEFGHFDKLSITPVTGQSYYQVKKASDEISGSVVIPLRMWDSTSSTWTNIQTIEASGFSGCSGVTSFKLPSTITTIPDSAFSGCSGISGFDFTNITSIGANAFENATSLNEITIPATLTAIGNSAFAGCSILSIINLASWDAVPAWTGTNIFSNISAKGTVNVKALTDTAVDQWRFNYPIKTFLKNQGITTWGEGDWSFDHADTATLVHMTNNVVDGWAVGTAGVLTPTEIYNMAMDKYNEPTLVIPATATSIADKAFIDASAKTTIPSTITKLTFADGSVIASIGQDAFSGSGIKTLILPASLTSIGQAAFYESALESITFPVFTNAITMGLGAFAECENLAYIDVSAYSDTPTWTCDQYLFDGSALSGQIKVASGLEASMLTWFKAHGDNINIGDWKAIN